MVQHSGFPVVELLSPARQLRLRRPDETGMNARESDMQPVPDCAISSNRSWYRRCCPTDMARLPRVLIVDDRPKVLALCARALEGAGYEAPTAPTAQVAMDLVEAAPPDAILIDLQVPYVHGLGMLYRLRKAHAHIPVAIITGLSNLDEAAVAEIRALGADVRVKPMSVDDIQTVARELLAKRDSAHAS